MEYLILFSLLYLFWIIAAIRHNLYSKWDPEAFFITTFGGATLFVCCLIVPVKNFQFVKIPLQEVVKTQRGHFIIFKSEEKQEREKWRALECNSENSVAYAQWGESLTGVDGNVTIVIK